MERLPISCNKNIRRIACVFLPVDSHLSSSTPALGVRFSPVCKEPKPSPPDSSHHHYYYNSRILKTFFAHNCSLCVLLEGPEHFCLDRLHTNIFCKHTSCRVSLRYGCTTGSPNGVVHFTVCPADAIICICHSRNFNTQKSYNERKRKTKNFMHRIQKLLSLQTLKKKQGRRNEID